MSANNGAIVKPPVDAPFSASVNANPRRRSNQYESVVAIAVTVVKAQPRAISRLQA